MFRTEVNGIENRERTKYKCHTKCFFENTIFMLITLPKTINNK